MGSLKSGWKKNEKPTFLPPPVPYGSRLIVARQRLVAVKNLAMTVNYGDFPGVERFILEAGSPFEGVSSCGVSQRGSAITP